MSPLIELKKVSLDLPVYGVEKQMLKKKILHLATGGLIAKNESKIITVRALDNISLTFHEGARVGLIGHNGAGKTTLLRLLSGIYEPTAGEASIHGKVTSLLDIMLGVNEESTGYDNIFLKGILLGLTKSQIEKKREIVAEFTQLGSYLDMPVRTYSSGMKIRLGFAMATILVTPQISLLDEVLGVGDKLFQQKTKQHICRVINNSSIVFFASHDLSNIQEVCSEVLWLEKGKVRFCGNVAEGIKKYKDSFKASDGRPQSAKNQIF
ncbi:MAG: ABC transporter ATP-binding protein [Chlamydiota bacterium]